MAYKSKVTEGKFKAIKILLASGATQSECAESMGLSKFTVGLINRSECYEEYKKQAYMHSSYMRKKLQKEAKEAKKDKEIDDVPVDDNQPAESEQPTQVVEYRQNVTIQATHYMMEELRKTNELLALISNKLAFIVDELTK